MVIKYSELKPKLNTGDIFLFSADFAISRVIESVTHSAYSHVGMVARYPDDELCFFEATTFSQIVDEADHELHTGVRIVSLEKLLPLYVPHVPGGFSVRLLTAERNDDFRQAFAAFVKEVDARPMADAMAMLAGWLEGKWLSQNANEKTFFCSQLIAATYQRVGLLPASPPANSYAPRDFSMANRSLPLLSGASLGEEIFMEWDGPAASGPTP